MVDASDVRAPGLLRCVHCVGGPLFSTLSMDNGFLVHQAHHQFALRMSVLFSQGSYSLDEARERTQPRPDLSLVGTSDGKREGREERCTLSEKG